VPSVLLLVFTETQFPKSGSLRLVHSSLLIKAFVLLTNSIR